MRWALTKNNVVLNVIEADQKFIDSIKKDYDYCIQADLNNPGAASLGDSYDPATGVFTRPNVQ